jgi:succinoglycan biosynthesis protein ExoM
MKVSICIITFQRPEGLQALLEHLAHLTFEKVSPPLVEVIVIDNEVNPDIHQLCHRLAAQFSLSLTYDVETQRGISYARNKAVSCVDETIDFIAFIDDDEWPHPAWLDELLSVQQLYSADVVAGPVLPILQDSVPDWIVSGQFFERPRHSSGTSLKGAATNNVLVRASLLRTMEKVFDDRWALSGGEDWHLFKRLYHAGCSMVWSNDAVVYEAVPASRTTLKWLLQRSYSHGNTESLCEIMLNPSFKTYGVCLFRGARRLIKGILWMPFCLLSKKQILNRNLKYLAHSLGLIAGVMGKNYEEYKQIHQT